MTSEPDVAMSLYGQAYAAYCSGEYEEALRLAGQVVKDVHRRGHPDADSINAHAEHVIKQARRRLDNPNPSNSRRLWWAIDGGWVISLTYGSLGAPEDKASA